MKLTENSMNCLNYVRDNGGRVSVPALAAGLNRTERSVNGTLLDLQKKDLIVREKVDEGGEKPVTYIVVTDAGKAFTPDAE